MCGIAGITSQKAPVSPEQLVKMRDTMTHRGPDDAGAWLSPDGVVGLAQRRLAIVDLSPRGRQPMADAEGRCRIVFNGEIYNHRELRERLRGMGVRFTSSSDTEVLLEAYRAWGTECLDRLNGMFAFCLYDERERRLFLARDRAGEKPLFYRLENGAFAFASELKALMAVPGFPRELDWEAAAYYLTYGYVPGSMCALKGFRKLAPAHAMTYHVDTGALRTWQYWRLPEQVPRAPEASDGELTDELEALLLDSVQRQLQADVPVGVLLSGGIDSSLVTALATRVASGGVRTFTVTFPGHGSYNEGPYARLVADHFQTTHIEIVAEPTTVDLLPRLAAQYDEPIADSSMVPTYLVSRAIREHATVALGGDGGDELFGGYPQHLWVQRLNQVARFIPPGIGRQIGAFSARRLPAGTFGKNYLAAMSSTTEERVACIGRLFDPETRRALLKPVNGSFDHTWSPEAWKASIAAYGRTPLQQSTVADFATFLPEDILVKVDRASMLTSLEVRAPWLDYRIIEFAFGRVPDRFRATTRAKKILPRMLAQRLLPRSLDLKRKQGFSIPLAAWFKGPWGRFFEDVLSGPEQILFDKPLVRSLLANQHKGYENTSRLFSLAMFELWRRHYRVLV